MADELIDPFVDVVGEAPVAPPIPADAEQRVNWARENIPGLVGASVCVDVQDAPAASAQAVLTSGVENYDFSAILEADRILEVIVDDYEGRKTVPGTYGTLVGGAGPRLTTTNGASDKLKVALHGETPQEIDIGTLAGGANIAAAIQAAVRALTAAGGTPENQQAYDGFTAEYTDVSFSTTLAVALANGVQVLSVVLTSVAGLKVGDTIEIADQSGGPAAAFSTPVFQIDRLNKRVYIKPYTPGEAIGTDALVRIRDDYFTFTSGKRGADSSVVVTAGATVDCAVALKLTSGAGGASASGTDADGPQRIQLLDSDFADPAAATAAEVIVAINRTLTGAIASLDTDKVALTSRKYGESANVKAEAGDVQVALDFATTIEVGTQTDVLLSLSGAEIVDVKKYTLSNGAAGAHLTAAELATLRVEGNKLVNAGSTDYGSGATLGWIITSRPTRRAA